MNSVRPYSVLASCYDAVMSHVDYAGWAAHVHRLLHSTGRDISSLLEIACGTGSITRELYPLQTWCYHGFDISGEMIAAARQRLSAEIRLWVADCRSFEVEAPYDAAIMVYDSVNYLVNPRDAVRTLKCLSKALKTGGVFIFDQSTPANSINNASFFEDEGYCDDIHFVRRSTYDIELGLHTTTFEIKSGADTFVERHAQRAYGVDEMAGLVEQAGLHVSACFDGFSTDPATATSERVHWIIEKK